MGRVVSGELGWIGVMSGVTYRRHICLVCTSGTAH